MKNWANNDCEAEEEDAVEIAQTGTSTSIRRDPYRDPPEKLFGNMRQHILEQIVGTGKWYPRRKCRICTANNRRGDTRRHIRKFCLVPRSGRLFSSTLD